MPDTLIAADWFSSPATANALLSTRTCSTGLLWERVNAGINSGNLSIIYRDSGVILPPKTLNYSTLITTNAATYRLDVQIPYSTLIVRGRASSIAGVATTGALCIGFLDADFNGYFAGSKIIGGALTGSIWKIDAAGVITLLDATVLITASGNPTTRDIRFEFDRATGLLSAYRDDVLISSIVDLSFTPLYPAVAGFPQAAATAGARYDFIDVNFFGRGDFIPERVFPVWTPINSRDYVNVQTLDFSINPSYEIDLETTLDGSTRIRGRTLALSTYAVSGAVTVMVDNAPVTIQAGKELIMPAPDRQSFTVSALAGVLRLRMFTIPYSIYQRD